MASNIKGTATLVLHILVATILIVTMSACYQTNQHYTLNPDGSGKVEIEATISPMMSTGNPDVEAKNNARDILEKSTGIDTWRGVEFKATEDGKSWFRGTAYFKSVSDLKLHNLEDVKIRFSKNDAGNLELEVENKKSSPTESKPKTPVPTSKEEIEKAVKLQKAQYQQARLMMSAFLSGMRSELSFSLPGKVSKKSNFTDTDGKLGIVFEGEKILEAIDEFTENDDWWREQVKSGSTLEEGPGPFGPDLNEKLFGSAGPIKATLKKKTTPQFDYGKELAEAQAGYDAMIESLGLQAAKPLPSAKGGDFTSLSVVRVSMSNLDDPDYNLFGTDKSYKLSLLGQLPGTVLEIEGGVLETAIADNGEDLLPESDWDREIRFPSLSQNKSAVLFDVTLNSPSTGVKGLKEVSGRIYYLVAGETKEVDAGLTQFKPGESGTAYDVKIESIEESSWQKGNFEMSLNIALPMNNVKNVTFFDHAGNKLDAHNSSAYGTSDGGSSFSYSLEGSFPQSGSIRLEVYEDMTKYEVPFLIANISLLGRSLD